MQRVGISKTLNLVTLSTIPSWLRNPTNTFSMPTRNDWQNHFNVFCRNVFSCPNEKIWRWVLTSTNLACLMKFSFSRMLSFKTPSISAPYKIRFSFKDELNITQNSSFKATGSSISGAESGVSTIFLKLECWIYGMIHKYTNTVWGLIPLVKIHKKVHIKPLKSKCVFYESPCISVVIITEQ